MILRLSTILFSLLLSLTSCSGVSDSEGAVSGDISIAHLKSLCRGDHYRITSDITLHGVVVANDWLGELQRSIIIVDESGGVEVAIDSREVFRHLPIYSKVSIFCNGLMLARIGGKVELGAVPTGDFPLGNIEEVMLGRYIRVEGVCNDFSTSTKRFSEIGIEDISNIVRFDGVRICDNEQGLAWCDTIDGEVATTYRTLIDQEGNTFAVRTLGTCEYATEIVPANEISVVGVVDYSDNRYFLRIVNKWIIQ